MNILMLLDKDNDFFAKKYKEYGVNVLRIYKDVPLFLKVIRRMHLKFKLPLYSLWFNKNWIDRIERFPTVILHASIIKVPVVEYINKKYPEKRVIFWYWNPVDKILPITNVKDLNCEVWSFDQSDCQKYNLYHNTQFYFSNVIENNIKPKDDVFFIGKDKGRLEALLEIKSKFEELKLKCYFHIVPDSRNKGNSKEFDFSAPIPYEEVVERISNSKAILDVVSKGQNGLTLRPLEALFMKKKLITNDSSIKNLDFYHPSNIFVIGEDKLEDLPGFINTPFSNVDKNIIMRYEFSNWLTGF